MVTNNFNLAKDILLNILRKTFLNSKCDIVCFNSYRGIILTRDNPFSNSELKNFLKDLNNALSLAVESEKNIEGLLRQLNTITADFNPYDTWCYYPENQYFVLKLFRNNQLECDHIMSLLVELLDNSRVRFQQDSGHLIVEGLQPAQDDTYNRIVAKLKKPENTNSELMTSETKSPNISTQPKHPKTKTRALEEVKSASFSTTPEESIAATALSTQLFPIFNPNLPLGSHLSRYSVPNDGILALKEGNKSYYERFFEVVKAGQMGGRGNRIAHLNRPRNINGLFGKSIFATHKLIIPSKDMRIYGEKKLEDNKNVIDFTTVVPSHKWANRSALK